MSAYHLFCFRKQETGCMGKEEGKEKQKNKKGKGVGK